MLRTRTRCTIVGMLLGLAALAPGAAHAAGFLKQTPVNLSNDTAPTVAMDANGNTLFAWPKSPPSVVQGAHHVIGTPGFTALPDFSTDVVHDNSTPVVVTNRAGNGIVAWVHTTDTMGDHEIQVRSISPNGTAGPVQTISTAGGSDSDLAAAINANGDAVLVWLHGATAQVSVRQGVNGSFSLEKTMPTDSNSPPSVAIDGAGNAIIAWSHTVVMSQIEGARHAAADPPTTWTAQTAISAAGHNYSHPVLASNPSGQLVVAFQDDVGPAVAEVSGTVSTDWGTTPAPLSQAGVNQRPEATVADNGAAAVGWTTASTVEVSIRPPGGAFPPPAGALSITPVPTTPAHFALAGNGHGALIAAWYSFETSVMQNVVRAAVKPAGASTFGASKLVSDPASEATFPVVAIDENGDAVAGYPLSSGSTPLGIGAAIYDNTPPTVGTPTAPSSVKQNVAAAFSTTATDAFSAVTLSWSFGDGSAAATGTHVTHTYQKPGTFTVKVTATDGAGNTSSASRSITVAPPPSTVTVATFGNQRITLTTPALQACTGKTGRLSVKLTSTRIANSRKTKLRFRSAAFYLDKGVKRTKRVTRHLRNGRKKRVTVVVFKPNATTRHVPATLALRVAGLKSGTHTLKVVLTYSKRVRRHGHSATVSVTKPMTVRFRVC
jgi:hypothetical protein